MPPVRETSAALWRDPWRVVLDAARDPWTNMAVDEAILARVAQGVCPPTVRFYGWDRPAISLGYHQVAEAVLDMERVRSRGIAVVKRPTGGRAVLHGDDLTYSVSLPEGIPWARTVTEAYRVLSEALRCGFRRAGLGVELARGHVGPVRLGPAPCFSSTARYELVWRGSKVVGSAQRRLRGGILQQGSIPLRRGDIALEELLPHGARARGRWVTVEEIAGRPVDPLLLARSLAEGFAERLDVELDFLPLDPGELSTEAA